MSTIKWISKETNSYEVQDLLNWYRNNLVAESVQITHVESRLVIVTFLLNQTFNSTDELNKALKESK